MITDAGLDEFVAGLASDQVIPRRKTTRKATPTGDAPTRTS